jgi:hypothetical protein
VHELAARGLEGLGNSRCLRYCLSTNLLVEAIVEQRLKLDARDHSLGEKGSATLHERKEVGAGSRLGEDNRLAEKRPALGVANVEGVGKAGQIGKGHVVSRRCYCIRKSRTVNVEAHAVRRAASSSSE